MQTSIISTTLSFLTAIALVGNASGDLITQWDIDLQGGAAIGDTYVDETDTVSGLVLAGVGSPTYSAPSPAAGSTASVLLSGTSHLSVVDSPILTGHTGSMTGYSSFTIDVWIRPDVVAFSQIVRKTGSGGDNNPGFELYLSSGGRISFGIHEADGTTHRETSDGAVISQDTWHHVVAYWDGSEATVTVNGVDSGILIAYDAPFVDTESKMGVGALIRTNDTTDQYFQGSIDNLTISTTPVPEPSSMVGVFATAACVLFSRRRNRIG